ncbi:MAG: LrgB family protein [Armatimonas sp.]
MMPALSLAITLCGFLLGAFLAKKTHSPLINPVVVGVLCVIAYLKLSKLPYTEYALQTKAISTLLAPAVVALALPLHEHTELLKKRFAPILLGSLFCITLGVATGWAVAHFLHAAADLTLALCSRSATAPIAMGIAERAQRAPALSGAIAILTGMSGATLGPWLLTRMKITQPLARGLSVGLVSHGIGTARILEESEEAGAASALGMCLSGITLALLLPALSHWLGF